MVKALQSLIVTLFLRLIAMEAGGISMVIIITQTVNQILSLKKKKSLMEVNILTSKIMINMMITISMPQTMMKLKTEGMKILKI